MKYIFSEGGDFLRIITIALFSIALPCSFLKPHCNVNKQNKSKTIDRTGHMEVDIPLKKINSPIGFKIQPNCS